MMEDFCWDEEQDAWVARFELSLDTPGNDLVPGQTQWYVLVSNAYPWGSIRMYPAADGGIQATFAHQLFNGGIVQNRPWRSGYICVQTPLAALHRSAYDHEPFDAGFRLKWTCERGREWLRAAFENRLTVDGEPFELPHWPCKSRFVDVVGVCEDAESFEAWKSIENRSGLVDLSIVGRRPDVMFATRFCDFRGSELLTPKAGRWLSREEVDQAVGGWIRLNSVPVIAPWQAPATWRELRMVMEAQGQDFARSIGPISSHLRDGIRHVLLVGFPIPSRISEEPSRMHWQAIALPELSHGNVKGFERTERGYRCRDRALVFKDGGDVDWQDSENWDKEQITSRGALPRAVTTKRIVLLGAGALGSAVGELLVRAGVERLIVLDPELFEAGNLVRHTLGSDSIGKHKASAVAARLNAASLHTEVLAVNKCFPVGGETEDRELGETDVIVDCTGADEVLFEIARRRFDEPKHIFSLSFSLGARRLYLLSARSDLFSDAGARHLLGGWLLRDREEHSGVELPREGIGCWHPVFPARADDVWLWAAVAVKEIERLIVQGESALRLLVFNKQVEEDRFRGVGLLSDEVVNA